MWQSLLLVCLLIVGLKSDYNENDDSLVHYENYDVYNGYDADNVDSDYDLTHDSDNDDDEEWSSVLRKIRRVIPRKVPLPRLPRPIPRRIPFPRSIPRRLPQRFRRFVWDDSDAKQDVSNVEDYDYDDDDEEEWGKLGPIIRRARRFRFNLPRSPTARRITRFWDDQDTFDAVTEDNDDAEDNEELRFNLPRRVRGIVRRIRRGIPRRIRRFPIPRRIGRFAPRGLSRRIRGAIRRFWDEDNDEQADNSDLDYDDEDNLDNDQ